MKYYLVFIAMVGAFIGGAFLQRVVLDPPMSCPEAMKIVKSWQACLSNRPQCQIDGPESYAIYHKATEVMRVEMKEGGDCK